MAEEKKTSKKSWLYIIILIVVVIIIAIIIGVYVEKTNKGMQEIRDETLPAMKKSQNYWEQKAK